MRSARFAPTFLMGLTVLALAAGICSAAADLAAIQAQPKEKVSGPLKMVKVEEFGPGASRGWLAYYPPFMELSLYQDPHNSHWMHLVSFKKHGKDERVTHFALIDVDDKTVTELGSVPGWEQYACLWVNGKFYLGMNNILLPGHLVEFDPDTKTITDLESPFKNNGLLKALAVAPDGTLALGGDPPEVAAYDPTTKKYTYYGHVGSQRSTKVIYVSIDADYIYASVRGTDPWHLVAINRKTQEQKELMQAPVEGIIALNRLGTIWTQNDINAKDETKEYYYVAGGGVHKVASYDKAEAGLADHIARTRKVAAYLRKDAPPKWFKDDSPTFEGKAEIKFLYEKPGEAGKVWREITFPLPLAPETLNRLARLPDGRLAYSGEKYAPLIVWDPKTGKTLQVPNATDAYHNSVYSMTTVGDTVFEGGYALAIVMAFDPDKPITQPTALPDRPAVPFASPEANPRLVQYYSKLAGGAHMAVAMDVGADGIVYLCARRHRYFFGFDIGWFDPTDFTKRGVIDAGHALDHYQMSWMCLSPDKETLIVSTYVQGNPQIKSPHPKDARLFFFDLRGRKIAKSIPPLPGAQSLSGVAVVAPSTLIGAAYLEKEDQTVLYRYNLETDKTELVRKFHGMIHGKPDTTGLPTKGCDFTTGPDGFVWTMARIDTDGPPSILRIDPKDLTVHPLCRIGGGNIRFVFDGNHLIVTGAEHLRRIKDVVGK